MRVAYASDLHLEFGAIDSHQLITDADYLFLAGDVAEARNFGKSINTNSGDYSIWKPKLFDLFTDLSKHYKAIFLVLGNHEYYHSKIGKTESIIQGFCNHFSNVFMLQDKMVDLDGYKLYGATMWTDMGLNSIDPLIEFKLKMRMNDFRCITYQSPRGYRKFNPADAAKIHTMNLKSLAKLQPDIIIQHHAPCSMSVPERFKSNELNPAYYSATLEDMLMDEINPKLIFHGHIHASVDYIWSNTRVLSNSRGYFGIENTDKFRVKVVEI